MVGFFDDDARRHRTSLLGYSVIGGYDALVSLIERKAVDEVVISTAQIDTHRLPRLQRLCLAHGVSLARLQVEFHELVAGRQEPGATVSTARQTSISSGRRA